MKKIIYLCLITIVAISFGCSKDEILLEPENSILKEKTLTDINSNLKGDTTKNQNAAKNGPISLPGAGNNIYHLYLNMDTIEYEYNSDPSNPSYSGPFNIFYRNLMSTHFSIYHVIESTNSSCGNVERWIVNLDELNQYLISIGLPEIDPSVGGYDWYIYGDPGGTTSNTQGVQHIDSTANTRGGGNHLPPPPSLPNWLINYNHCFAL